MVAPSFFKEVFDQLAIDGFIGEPKGKLAYCYLRVSSTAQAEEGRSGLPRQIMHVHEAAARNALKIPWELVFADDHTGFEFQGRPELSRLRQEMKIPTRAAHAIVMENLDRLSRNADWHQGFLLEEMKEYGLGVVFWHSFSSRIERAVIGAISQEGMEQAQQRMAEGNLFKARDGRVTARVPAYGYILVDSEGAQTEKAKKDTHYAPYTLEAEVVRLIYTKVGVEGWSLRQLSAYLEGRFPPPKRSAHWEPRQISLIITNPVYKGEFIAHRHVQVRVARKGDHPEETVRLAYKKIQRPREDWIIVPVPALVSTELWEMANRMLEKNAQMGKRNAQVPYLLTSIVKCASCGHTYVGGRKRKLGEKGQIWQMCYYRCSSRSGRAPHVVRSIACPQSQVSCRILEDAVWSAVCAVLLQPNTLTTALEQDFGAGPNCQLLTEIDLLEKQIREKDYEDERLFRAYLANAFDEHEFAARRAALRTSRQEIEREVRELRERVITKEQLEERKSLIAAMTQSTLASRIAMDAPFDVKRSVIKLVVDKIILNVNEGWFRIEGIVRGEREIPGDIERIPMDRGSRNTAYRLTYRMRPPGIVSVSVLSHQAARSPP